MSGKPRRVPGVAGLIGSDVEARVSNGSIVRGVLVEVGERFVVIERASTHRRAFVALDHLAVLVDESAPCLSRCDREEREPTPGDQDEEGA